MSDYKKMYKSLFQDVTKAIKILQKAQRKAEEICVSYKEEDIELSSENGIESESFVYPKKKIKRKSIKLD